MVHTELLTRRFQVVRASGLVVASASTYAEADDMLTDLDQPGAYVVDSSVSRH